MEEKGKDISVLGRALSNLPNLEGNTITSERASLSDRPGENQESWGKCLIMKRLKQTFGFEAFINKIFQQDSIMHTYGLRSEVMKKYDLWWIKLKVRCSTSHWRWTAPTINKNDSLWPDPKHLDRVELLIPEGCTWLSSTNQLLLKPARLRRLELIHLRLNYVPRCFTKVADVYFPSSAQVKKL